MTAAAAPSASAALTASNGFGADGVIPTFPDLGVGGGGYDESQELVQSRGPSDAFGELALMYNVPRQASVTCVSDYAVLWALGRSVYRDVTQLQSLDSIQSIIETLQSVELLAFLEEDQFNRLIDSFEMVNYYPSDRIIRQGELGNAFYIILKGTVNCIQVSSKQHTTTQHNSTAHHSLPFPYAYTG